ncbi:uncharacterized protein CLUP02_08842 [Colletotrichum lupini]|uniref:Uncharacterized protein n=1 Tax=Colletotrichum lupini TaxID=145971 RepID=A0A9Q8WHU8_9PEZI|nr:uncharacterized protein CLUP02_08842 [Colletotrichum lupini]UQC83347.1 hypothetical protein CLUP02_08842 [Colletotrichum lupini]
MELEVLERKKKKVPLRNRESEPMNHIGRSPSPTALVTITGTAATLLAAANHERIKSAIVIPPAPSLSLKASTRRAV